MPGLAPQAIDALNDAQIAQRIKVDLRSDFILAPHFNTVFLHCFPDLAASARSALRSGTYNPGLPYTISVPKPREFTRPGSVLSPVDRYVYQGISDLIGSAMEKQLDRSRTFSHVPSHDNEHGVFEPAHESWSRFQSRISNMCERHGSFIKADIAHYFERLPQHALVNLLRAAECNPAVVSLLEEMLLAFRQRDSVGIIQGVFPSDVLGNFFLSEFDAYCEMQGIESARYMDDIYMHFRSANGARRGLIDLIERLRKNGLQLNEAKSGVRRTAEVRRDAHAVDDMFDDARTEARRELEGRYDVGYGFDADWETPEPDEEEVTLAAVEALLASVEQFPAHSDEIEKFCLPSLRAAGSPSAVAYCLKHLSEDAHMTRTRLAYLTRFVPADEAICRAIETFLQSATLIMSYQRMYGLGALLPAKHLTRDTINLSLRWLGDNRMPEEVRALAAILAARHGNPNQKRAVRLTYEGEPSSYVRSAILYSSKFFTAAEPRTCRLAWGGHTPLNALVAKAISRA